MWLSGKESAASIGDTGSIPDPGGSRMPWSNYAHVPIKPVHWSPGAAAAEAMCREPVLHNERPLQ